MIAATFDSMISVNLRDDFLVSREIAPYMAERKYGYIINLAFQLALKGGKNLPHCCSAKAGVLGQTKSMAHEFSPFNVLTNAIAPGPILTLMIVRLSSQWISDKEAEIPLSRFGKAEEVVATALMSAFSPVGDLYFGQALGPNSDDVM